jgi:thiol:disulfide interchange protein DsbD
MTWAMLGRVPIPMPQSASAAEDPVQASLVAEAASIEPGKPFWVALRLTMQDGWHVNWLNPGDAGLPPSIQWTLPEGFTAGDLLWPYPKRFDLPGVSIFGYAGEVFLLAEIRPPAGLRSKRVELRAKVDWLACSDICTPGEASLELSLPVRHGTPVGDPESAGAFEAARARLPRTSPEWTFRTMITEENITLLLFPPDDHSTHLERVGFFPRQQGIMDHAASQILRKTPTHYLLEIERDPLRPGLPNHLEGVLVSEEGWGFGRIKSLSVNIPVETGVKETQTSH